MHILEWKTNEIKRLNKEVKQLIYDLAAMEIERDKLKTDLAAVKSDAERYQWLASDILRASGIICDRRVRNANDLRDAIDTAISEGKSSQTSKLQCTGTDPVDGERCSYYAPHLGDCLNVNRLKIIPLVPLSDGNKI